MGEGRRCSVFRREVGKFGFGLEVSAVIWILKGLGFGLILC